MTALNAHKATAQIHADNANNEYDAAKQEYADASTPFEAAQPEVDALDVIVTTIGDFANEVHQAR